MAVSAESLVAGAKILQKPLNDLYELGKQVAGSQLSRWRSNKHINQLYKKVAVAQKVKTIWQVDKEVKLLSFYYPSKLTIDGEPKAITNVRDLPQTNNIVLQGTVGQGKSIFLRYLCIRELGQGTKIPIFLELRRLERGRTLRSFMYEGLRTLGFDIDNQLFDFYAHSGKFIFLLDGFDELDKELVTTAINELEGFAQKYPQMQILVTSRPDSGIERSAHFRVYRLAPLTESDHRPFLEKIVPESHRVNEILKAIKQNSAKIGGLLTTPLMMTLLVIIYKAEQTVPNELSDFYDNLFQTLLTRHDKSKPGFVRKRYCQLGERQIQELFESFCFVTRQREFSVLTEDQVHECVKIAARHSGVSCDAKAFLQDMAKVACLMQEEGFKYHFVHKSVQEYHAASFMRHCPEEMAIQFYAKLQDDGKWAAWRQELEFLSQIDKYRFARFFKLPLIVRTLAQLGISNGGTEKRLTDNEIDKILLNSSLLFRKSGEGFILVSGTLGQSYDYVLGDFELNCFHKFFGAIGAGRVLSPELSEILSEVKAGNEMQYQCSVPRFFAGSGQMPMLQRTVAESLEKILQERSSLEEYVRRQEGKKELLELS